MIDKKIAFLALGIVFLTIISFCVSAQNSEDVSNEGTWIDSLRQNKFSDYTLKILGFEKPTPDDKIFGFKLPSFYSSGNYFFVGLLVGLFLWISSWGVKFFWRFIRKTSLMSRTNPFKRIKNEAWIVLIAGQWWSIFLFGVGYFTIMQIPILNRILQIISLESLFNYMTTRALWLTILIGFLPSIVVGSIKRSAQARAQQRAVEKGAKIMAAAPK